MIIKEKQKNMKKIKQFLTKPFLSKQLITTIFKPLSKLDKSLPERITQYILHGDELAVLVDFDKLCQISDYFDNIYELLQRPADFYSLQNYDKIHPSLQARIDFYKSWTDTFTPEQIIRFARILAIVCDYLGFHEHINEQIPSWFIYLIYDGLITTLPSHCEEDNANGIIGRENWSVQQLHQFLESEQVGLGEKLLFAIFDGQSIAVDHCHYFTRLNGLLTYIQDRIELFKQLPSLGLALLGQVEQLKYIQRYPELQLKLVDFIALQALNTSKQVNQLAIAILFNLPHELVQPQLQLFLTSGSAKERAKATILLSQIISEPTILQQALVTETNKTVIAAIESALSRIETANPAKQQIDLVIPGFEPLIDTPLPITARSVIQQNFDKFLIECKELMLDELEQNQEYKDTSTYCLERYKQLQTVTSKSLDNIFEYLNGNIDRSALFKEINENIDFDFLLTENRLLNFPEFSLFHLFRIRQLIDHIDHINDTYYFNIIFDSYSVVKQFDLRQLADVMEKVNFHPHVKYIIASPFLTTDFFHDIFENEPHKLWAFFAENDFLIDQTLGLTSLQFNQFYDHPIDKINAIKILRLFPTIPNKYVACLLELALSSSNAIRDAAQEALMLIPNIHNQIEQGLSSSKQEVRINTANWLAELGQKSSIKALNTALKKEKRETVQTAILVALEKMGEDISQHLTSQKLLTDAQKGLKGKIPTELDWFDFNLIPSLTWQNGKTVEPQIIRWWICLAVKLKDPANPLLTIYNRLLSTQSQQQLGEFILQSFIKQDTLSPTLEEAEAIASSEAEDLLQQRILNYQRYPEFCRKYKDITYEQVFEEIKQETLAIYLGSAIKAKGILALTCGIEGRVAVSLLRSFMKDHYQRRAQIEAMLEPLANSDDPMIIQLLLSIARRYRMTSIQEQARYLIECIAERSGWTTDELADRTISTAGLDDNGLLILDYGERSFIASLDDKFKWHLKNADGEKIKTLPEARKSENPELVKEAKKQFSNSKKELNQLLKMQINRFYEAMCAQRQWRVEDWQKYLQPHPIMGRFIQLIVWLQLDNNGQIVNSFRPTEDGSLITNQDEEILLDQNHLITVAHSALLSSEDIVQWQVHLKDYKVIPLFAQFNHLLPEISKFKDGIIDDRLGWLTDSFTIRNILNKLDFKRDNIEDGGCFFGYHKYFESLDIYIKIEFSGSMVPEENIPAVLYSVYFTKYSGNKDKVIALDKVPQVLLAEGYANYMAVANSCSGFDPNWTDISI